MGQEQGRNTRKQDEVIRSILGAIHGLEFGEVHVTVHGSQIVRIERIERIRLNDGSGRSTPRGPRQGGEDEMKC